MTMKLKTNNGDIFLEGETKEHVLLQLLVFFDCQEMDINFEEGTFKVLDIEGVIENGQ